MVMLNQKRYHQFYEAYKDIIVEIFKDTKRAEYEAEVWYSFDRNYISLDMIGDKWKDENVVGIGSAFWPDGHLLDNIPCQGVLRTDLIQSDGVELLCDACNLPFADGSIGAIVCREVIEHVINENDLLYEFKRVLKDKGWLFLTTPNGFNLMPDGALHLRAYSPHSFIRELERYGFEIVDKRGDCPNVWRSLMPLCRGKYKGVLDEFKLIGEIVRNSDISYYVGTDLFILAQKKENDENTPSST